MSEESRDEWELKPATDHGLPLGERLRSSEREPGIMDSSLSYLWWGLMRQYMRFYHRLRIEGKENLPRNAPFVMIANHSSHLDAMALSCVLPRRLRSHVYPIAAGDTFFESPTTASFAAFVLNALPMWRRSAGRHALEQLRSRLSEEPCGYVLFPEGTRSRDGKLGRFKPGLGMMVAGSATPVIPCRLEGAFAAMGPGMSLPRPRRLCLKIGKPMHFEDRANDRSGWTSIAKELEAVVAGM